MGKTTIIMLGITLLSLVLGIYVYPHLPEHMASHWNIHGEVDGAVSKFWGVFFIPIIIAGLCVLSFVVARTQPIKTIKAQWSIALDVAILFLALALVYLHLFTIVWNLGFAVHHAQMVAPFLGILFYYCGIRITQVKRNLLFGIRTPWTLCNESVWVKTHAMGGKLLKVAGVITFLGVCFPNVALALNILPATLVAMYTIIYSYIVYQKESQSSHTKQ